MRPESLAALVSPQAEAARAGIVELCGALVSAPSITPPGDTRAAAGAAVEWLAARGVAARVIGDRKDMPNIVAEVSGTEPGPHLILNGHLDTMGPGDASRWTVPQFELSRSDGRLYGLGMGNMKGAVAAMCAAAVILARNAEELAGTVTLLLVSDEVRFGDHGARFVLEHDPRMHGDAVISGEGSGWMTLAVAEKGLAWLDLRASGSVGHASAALRGETAAACLAGALHRLDELNDWHVEPPPALAGALADPAHPGRRVALNAGILGAGDARSMIAPDARAELDVRLPPGLTLESLDARLLESLEDSGVEYRRSRSWEANWTDPADDLTQAVSSAARLIRGDPPVLTVRHPASDAMRWRLLGRPAVCYGPQPTLSAGVDDYAVEQDVIDCCAVYALAALIYGRSPRPD